MDNEKLLRFTFEYNTIMSVIYSSEDEIRQAFNMVKDKDTLNALIEKAKELGNIDDARKDKEFCDLLSDVLEEATERLKEAIAS